jgi:2-phospho-L-lactate guanylyltransferase
MDTVERTARAAGMPRQQPDRAVSAVIPIRSFDGLTRLSSILDAAERSALMRRLAMHTIEAIRNTGIRAFIVSSDREVARWAAAHADSIVPEPTSGGLNAAARAGVAAVDGPWIVIHADLPALSARDVAAATRHAVSGIVLAPSHDGGTSLIGAPAGGFPFSYGPGSFRRHASKLQGRATVLVRPGLALDLDRPWDLAALERLDHL